jgi:hypothetical protein
MQRFLMLLISILRALGFKVRKPRRKPVWTDEMRKAASERMRARMLAKYASKRGEVSAQS